MPIQTTVDEFGHEHVMRISAKGHSIFINFNEETVDNLPNLKLRKDDIIQCSYPKAGCHWTWEILRLMVWGKESPNDEKHYKERYMIEANTEEELDSLPSPRIFNHHIPFDYGPKELIEKNVKVVYVYRNIKDIAVSYYHHTIRLKEVTKYDAPFKHYLRRFAAGLVDCGGNVFDYMKSWDEGLKKLGPQAIVLCYEDLKKHIIPELRRLADFLEVQLDDEALREIADLTDFSAMQSRKTQEAKKIIAAVPCDTGPKDIHRTDKLVKFMLGDKGTHMMYRKGQTGDWKNHFTVADSEWFDQLIKERLGDLTYHKFQYE